MTSALLDVLAAQPEYGPTLRRLVCELAIAGRLLPRAGDWAEHRLDNIVSVRGGSTPSMARPEYWGGDIPWVSPKDMHAGEIVTSEMFITQEALAKTNLELVPLGSVLIVGRSGILKRKLPAQVTRVPCTVNQDIKALTPSDVIDSAYLRLWLLGSEREILAEDVKTGTTVQSVVFQRLFARRVLLPPIKEQYRIVAKVDGLMALCDRLEARQQEAEAAHSQLVQALLDSLTKASNADEFQACWQRLAREFDRLFNAPGPIDRLKAQIVRLGVDGRLTDSARSGEGDQSPNLRREVALASIAKEIVDCPHSTPKWADSGEICVRTSQFRPGSLDLSTARFVSRETFLERIARLEPQAGDVLYSREGGILGVACRIPPGVRLCLGQRMMLIRPSSEIDGAYLELVLNSPQIKQLAKEQTTGGAAPRINVSTVRAFPIPLPPLSVQLRIVAKVSELLAICDQLTSSIADSRAKHAQLSEELVARALAA